MTSPSILVIRGGAIGDFILTLPVLSALREQFPAARIEVLGYPRIASLALMGGLVDAVGAIESRTLATFFASRATLDPAMQEFFGRFALIISYLYDPDGIFQENVRSCSGAQIIAGPHRPDERGAIHATECFLQPLERLAIFAFDPTPRLEVPMIGENSDAIIRAGSGRWLAVHPGSGSELKNWSQERWRELLQQIMDHTSARILLVGAEAEAGKLDRLARVLPPDRVRIADKLPLPALAQELKGCAGFVGHDSGITHLAAAVGVPAVALWGETSERVWAPRATDVRVLRGPQGLSDLRVETVFAAVISMIERSALEK